MRGGLSCHYASDGCSYCGIAVPEWTSNGYTDPDVPINGFEKLFLNAFRARRNESGALRVSLSHISPVKVNRDEIVIHPFRRAFREKEGGNRMMRRVLKFLLGCTQ
jgi:hypothetical protein